MGGDDERRTDRVLLQNELTLSDDSHQVGVARTLHIAAYPLLKPIGDGGAPLAGSRLR